MGSGQPGSGSAARHIARLFAEGSLTGLSDGQLLERYLAHRDELAFAALVERHAAVVLAVCRRSLDDAGDIDDAFQATFLVLARCARAVRDQKVLGSWLFGVARRVSLLANRAAARRKRHERQAAEQRGTWSQTSLAEEERGRVIYEEIERLPTTYQLPVLLCLMEGRSRADAAGALRWTEGMVRGRLARARRLLRARLIRRGVAPAAVWTALARDGTAAGPMGLTVSRGLIEATAQAATLPASGRAAATALTEGVIKIMLFKKLTLSACVIAGALLVAWAATAALVDEGQAPAAGTAPIAGAPSAAILLNDPGKSALHGRVLQPDGKPVAGARVWASGIVQGPPSAIKELAEDYTDVEGRFRLGPFESQYRNRLEFNVEPPHRFAPLTIPRSAMLTFPGLDWDLGTILLDPGRVFTGQVLDFDGKPVQWAKIAVYRHEAGHTVRDIGPHITLTTDVEGRFRTPPLHVGRLALSVRVPERQVAFAARTIRPGGEEDLGTIRLEKDLPVTGIVKDDDGRPVAGATVFSGVSSAVSTDNEGKFTLRGFGPNPSFQMNVRKDGYALLIGRVTVNEAGIRYETANNANPAAPPRPAAMTPELTVTLKRVGWLEEPKTVGGLVARLKKKGDDTAPAAVHETITGTVTRDGRPVQFGWVGVWRVPQSRNPINAPVLRGRMVMGPPISYGVAIHGGAYAVDLPFPGENWYVVVEEPGHPLTQVGPISVARNQKKTLDIACKEGGRIRGRVTGVPPGWEGNVWVVAFSKSAVREEARVARDGTFSLPALPAGEYGLKAGHDAYEDAEVYPVDVRTLARDHPEVFQETADPWKRAKVVTVEAGKDTTGVELELPAR